MQAKSIKSDFIIIIIIIHQATDQTTQTWNISHYALINCCNSYLFGSKIQKVSPDIKTACRVKFVLLFCFFLIRDSKPNVIRFPAVMLF